MNDKARMTFDQLGETTIPSIGNALHELKDRRAYLQYLIRKKEKSIAKAPEGYLIVQKAGRGKSLQYYRVTYDERNRRCRTYISKRKDLPLIRALAQKDYDRKVLEAANLELSAIDGLLTHIPKNSAENIYALLDLQRALLVHPDDCAGRGRPFEIGSGDCELPVFPRNSIPLRVPSEVEGRASDGNVLPGLYDPGPGHTEGLFAGTPRSHG